MGSRHALLYGGDGDKCLCTVRISSRAGRRAALTPADLDCDECVLRTVQSWARIGVNIDDLAEEGTLMKKWPWDDPRWRDMERREASRR